MSEATRRPYELLEHTADIGLRAWGETREALFENCALGLAEILDRRWREEQREVAAAFTGLMADLEAPDIEALLVEWMNELLFLLERDTVCLSATKIREMDDTRLSADIVLDPCAHTPEGTELKAATYHQLAIRRRDSQWEATVFFDV
ncbi:MAG TPA: archease [Actinomycetota bacterium]|nr:archease [Actinomycetota bacterium]